MNSRNHNWKSELERLSPEQVREIRKAHDQQTEESGRWDSNPRHFAWEKENPKPTILTRIAVFSVLLAILLWFSSGLATHGVDFKQAIALGIFLIATAFGLAWLSRKVGL